MKYVKGKDGKIEILADGDSIPAGAETIFSTDPSVYEGTWETSPVQKKRADIVTTDEGKVEVITGGTMKSPIEKKIEREERGREGSEGFWREPHKAHPKDKVCLNCGKIMKGVRPNKKFCSDRCRKDYSQKQLRAEKKIIKNFVPHKGHEGQIYYILDGKIGFIPALWCNSQKRAEKYVKTNYPVEAQEVVIEQVKEIMGNG